MARLALEAPVGLRVELDVGAQDLQRHRALELLVDGPVDLGQGTLPQEVLDGVELEVGELHPEGSSRHGVGGIDIPASLS